MMLKLGQNSLGQSLLLSTVVLQKHFNKISDLNTENVKSSAKMLIFLTIDTKISKFSLEIHGHLANQSTTNI